MLHSHIVSYVQRRNLFVAGSRNKDLLQTDAFSAVKPMKIAESNGASRYIMLSSAYSLEPNKWYNPEMLAQH